MTTDCTDETIDLPCHQCGYDLRAHPRDGKCPECGALVAEAVRVAAIPRRSAWRDSDPRWRRRMVAGTWVLVLLPLRSALDVLGWSSSVPIPNFFGFPGTVRTLNETFLSNGGVYEPLLFCIGVVLLFSKERGRQRHRLDWTRRWGVLCSYVVLLLSAVPVLFMFALVSVGIAAIFQSMPPKYQPNVTELFVELSTRYLRYGPHPSERSGVVLVAFSSITILLACAPLFDALRSTGGPRWVATSLLAPLALFALMHLAQVGRYLIGSFWVTSDELLRYRSYFWPELLAINSTRRAGWNVSVSTASVIVEAIKWGIVLAVAVWLTAALFAPCLGRLCRRWSRAAQAGIS